MEYIHNFETVSAFTEEYEGNEYKEPWVSYVKENGMVKYNKHELWLEFDLTSTANTKTEDIFGQWSSDTTRMVYPITGGDVNDFIDALNNGVDIRYLAHNYEGADARFNSNFGEPIGMEDRAFGLSCGYGFDAMVVKIKGTDNLCLVAQCMIG